MNWKNIKWKCKNEKCNKSLDFKGQSLDKEKRIRCEHCGTENLITKKKNGKLIVL